MLFLLLFLSHAQASEDPDELYRQGRFTEAEKEYAREDMDSPKDVRYRYNRGCAAFQNSDYKGAEAAFSSVLRRTEDREVRYKAAYNLGNTAFKQGDFESAVSHYGRAIQYDPENEDARYNMELALREVEKLKKKKSEEQEHHPHKDSQKQGDKKDKSDKEKKKESDKQSEDQEKGDKGEQAESGKEESPEKEKARPEREGKKSQQEASKDLSGELQPLQAMPDQEEDKEPEHPGSMLDKKKAEALLDNLKEDRSKVLRFQIPEDRRGGVPSGKDW